MDNAMNVLQKSKKDVFSSSVNIYHGLDKLLGDTD